jgi:hypothetical protein
MQVQDSLAWLGFMYIVCCLCSDLYAKIVSIDLQFFLFFFFFFFVL